MPKTPEFVLQRQLEAYNNHDIEAFMLNYSHGILFLEFPSNFILKVGHKAVRTEYEEFLRDAKPHITICSQVTQGDIVISHEKGSNLWHLPWEAVMIYEVINGLIERVWFVGGGLELLRNKLPIAL